MSDAHHWIVDEIEEGMAAVEIDSGKIIHLPLAVLPKGVKPGDVIRATLEIDAAATKQALAKSVAQVKKGRDASRKLDTGGDIVL
jgi:hypothetical protein